MHPLKLLLSLGVTLAVLLGTTMAQAHLADDPNLPGLNQLDSMEKYFSFDEENYFEAGLGYRLIDEDSFISLDARLNLNLGPVGLGLQAPLNFRVHDAAPKTDQDYSALRIRHEDWDGGVEWLRVIRYIRLGNKGQTFYLRFGELTGDLGHQSIVGHYNNNTDINAFHSGLEFDLNLDYGGAEILFNDIFQMGSDRANTRLFATRLHVNPVAFVNKDSYWKRFSVGFTVATDIGAPTALAFYDDGTVMTHDDKPKAAATANTTIIGWDIDLKVLDSEQFNLVPYFDMNFIVDGGMGIHTGLSGSMRFKALKGIAIPWRIEYRGFQSNYLPDYFNSFYDIERYQYGMNARTPTTKRQYLDQHKGEGWINGMYTDLALDIMGYVQFGAIYEDYKGAAANFSLYLNVPAWERAQFTFYYSRTDIRGGKDLFSFDDRTTFLALTKVKIIKFLYVAADYSRTWQLNDAIGRYEAVNNFNFRVLTQITF